MMYIITNPQDINVPQIIPKTELKHFSYKLGIGTQVNKEGILERELSNLWEIKAQINPAYWSQKTDGDFRKSEQRNKRIEQIRDKYLKDTKVSKSSYGKLGDYFYKSPEHYRQFLDEVERERLINSSESKITEFHSFNEWDKFETDAEDQGDFYR